MRFLTVFTILIIFSFSLSGKETIHVHHPTDGLIHTTSGNNISFSSYYSVIDTFYMCSTPPVITDVSGILYDSGGPNGTYGYYEYCSALIAPDCATSISITIDSLSLSLFSFIEFLTVYDGSTTASPVLFSYSYGNFTPVTITTTGSSALIRFYSNNSNPGDGFKITWTTTVNIPPQLNANFVASNQAPPVNSFIQFTDSSDNDPLEWIWDFGDGDSSTQQNPQHYFTTPGIKNVTLIASNCASSDTITQVINVQDFPSISVNPSSFTLTLPCGDSAVQQIAISNNGPGQLVFDLDSSVVYSSGGPAKILFYTTSVNTSTVTNILNAINEHFTNYTLSQVNTSFPSVLQNSLINKDILIIPQTYSLNLQFAPILTSFVNNGGRVIIVGNDYIQALNQTGLLTISASTYVTGMTLDIQDPFHHLSDSLQGMFNAQPNTYAYDTVNSDFHKVISIQGKTIAGYRSLGRGKVILLGFSFGIPDTFASQVIGNAVRWASGLSPYTALIPDLYGDTLSTNDTTYINISINTQNLIAGNYNLSLEINSNDSLQQFTPVEFNLTVTGSPELILSDTCFNYGTIQQFTYAYDTLMVINSGCDTLVIDSVISSGPQFIPAYSSFFVQPWDTVYLPIAFYPDSTLSFSGTLLLSNNVNDTIICVEGAGSPSPEITVVDDSLFATVTCGDSITVSFTIYNTGDMPLTYQFMGLDSADVLAFIYGADYFNEYPNTMNAIRQTFDGFRLTTLSNSSPGSVQNELIGKEVFYMAKQENGNNNNYAALDTVLSAFINSGGDVVIHGTNSYYSNNIFNTGLIEGAYATNAIGATLNVSGQNHVITDSLPQTITGISNSFTLDISPGSGFIPLISDSNGFSLVAYKDSGYGKVVYNGFDYDTTDIWSTKLAGNIMKWVAEDPIDPWIHLQSTSDTILPQGSVTINITFSAADLIAGSYNEILHIATNDPHFPVYDLPCTFLVTGEPLLALSDTCLDFENTWLGFSYSQNIQVINAGCDSLIVDNISVNPPYSVSVSSLAIPAFSTGTIEVTCEPLVQGIYNSNLVLQNNASDTIVCLTTNATVQPLASCNVSTINETLTCSEIIAIPVTLYNSGGAPLIIDPNDIPPPGPLKVLAFGYGVDSLFEYINTLNAINTGFTNYTVYRTNTEDPDLIKSYLDTTDILLFPEFETGITAVLLPLSPVFENFAQTGGNVLFCASEALNGEAWLNTGLMDFNIENNVTWDTLTVNGTHPIIDNIVQPFIAPNLTLSLNIINPSTQHLVQEGTNDVVATWPFGYGEIVYAGFDFFSSNTNSVNIIANSMKWLARNSLPYWFSTSLSDITILPGDSAMFVIYLNSDSLPGGTHTYTFSIQTNDPSNPLIEIPVTVTSSPTPCAAINYNLLNCEGLVDFTSQVSNPATSYLWYFGDGSTSTLPAPQHLYNGSGVYNVSLVTCNGFGCDSVFVQINLQVNILPVAANCIPQTINTCCGMGITSFSFANLNNTSPDATSGYEDFTCISPVQVMEGIQYPVSISNGPLINENVFVWIDFNNDGDLSVTEQVFTGLSALIHNGQITIPTGAVLNTPLRMRVGSENATSPLLTSCTNSIEGQFEDYTIKIYPFESPTAQYMVVGIDTCNGIFQFIDMSSNAPNSWLWDFGDGNTSSSQNVTHQYSVTGTYNVTLTVTNASGFSQITFPVNVHITQVSIGITGSLLIGNPIQFSGTGTGFTSWYWNFGDGNSTIIENPVHSYAMGGIYTITLTITDSLGCTATADTIISIITGTTEFTPEPQIYVAPNPFTSQTDLVVKLLSETDISFIMFNALGKTVLSYPSHPYNPGTHRINLIAPAAGIYYLKVWMGERSKVLRIIKL